MRDNLAGCREENMLLRVMGFFVCCWIDDWSLSPSVVEGLACRVPPEVCSVRKAKTSRRRRRFKRPRKIKFKKSLKWLVKPVKNERKEGYGASDGVLLMRPTVQGLF
jgi:hypothetical protein